MSKNVIVELCNELEKRYKLEKNKEKYDFVYGIVLEKICENLKIVYRFKSEIKDTDYSAFNSTMIATMSMFLSSLSILFNIEQALLSGREEYQMRYGTILLIAMIVVAAFLMYIVNKYKNVSKWKGYIEVVLDNLPKEIENMEEEQIENVKRVNVCEKLLLTVHVQNISIDIYDAESIKLVPEVLFSIKKI